MPTVSQNAYYAGSQDSGYVCAAAGSVIAWRGSGRVRMAGVALVVIGLIIALRKRLESVDSSIIYDV